MASAFPQHLQDLQDLMHESRTLAGEAPGSDPVDLNDDNATEWQNGTGWADFTKNL